MAGSWSEVHIESHPVGVYEPSTPAPHGGGVLYLHSVGQERLADCPAYTLQLERHGLRALAPHTGVSWWNDRLCPGFDPRFSAERYLLEHVLPYASDRWGLAPPKIALLGISMGGQGALRLAYRKPALFPVTAAVSPAIDFHRWMIEGPAEPGLDRTLWAMYGDPERARQDTATLHIHPLNWPRRQFFVCDPDDPWHEGCDRLRMKLGSLGVPSTSDLETHAGGHSWDYFNAMAERAIGFVAEGLSAEASRC